MGESIVLLYRVAALMCNGQLAVLTAIRAQCGKGGLVTLSCESGTVVMATATAMVLNRPSNASEYIAVSE